MAFYEISGEIGRINNERSSVTSTKELARSIDDVCSSIDPDYYREVDISLPQNDVIYPKILKPILKETLATFQISRSGDPDFIIYHNDFPQLEDLTWLISIRHQVSPYEIFQLPFPNSDNKILKKGNKKKINNYLLNFIKQKSGMDNITQIYPIMYKNETNSKYFMINNIIPYNSTEGKWNKKYPYIYTYNLSSYELNIKFMRKYQICGNHSICLKTNKFLYTFPLKCDEYIELEKGINPEDSNWFKNLIKNTWNYKAKLIGNTSTSFYMASPCKIKVRIKKGKCLFYKNYTYPIYEYKYNKNDNDYELLYIGNRTLYQKEWENDLVNITPYNQNYIDCIQIVPISSSYGFCYSSPNMAAALFGAFTHKTVTGLILKEMSFISEESSNLVEERSKMENYILKKGIGKIKKFFFTWPDHPLN